MTTAELLEDLYIECKANMSIDSDKVLILIEVVQMQAEALEFYNDQDENGDLDLSMYSEKITEDAGDTARETKAAVDSKLKGIL